MAFEFDVQTDDVFEGVNRFLATQHERSHADNHKGFVYFSETITKFMTGLEVKVEKLTADKALMKTPERQKQLSDVIDRVGVYSKLSIKLVNEFAIMQNRREQA